MRKTKLFLFIMLPLILSSCSGGLTSIYDSDSPLSDEIARSDKIPLTVTVPQDWFTAVDNECGCIDLWLIKNDYSETLKFVSLNLDSLSSARIKTEGIAALAGLSKEFKKAKYGKDLKGFINEEIFEINKNEFAAYQYFDSENHNVRVVVFRFGSKYYECTAIPLKSGHNSALLYSTENSVLGSLR
jgi:hypothetical protein